MKYYSQYRSHDLFELQESLSGLSKSNRWVKLADHLPWGRIEKEYNKRLRNSPQWRRQQARPHGGGSASSKSIGYICRVCSSLGMTIPFVFFLMLTGKPVSI